MTPMTNEMLRDMYLDLMRKCLIGIIYDDPPMEWKGPGVRQFNSRDRDIGMDWPSRAHSMIGSKRMLQLQRATEFVLQQGIPGDLIETGVWRGGSSIINPAT